MVQNNDPTESKKTSRFDGFETVIALGRFRRSGSPNRHAMDIDKRPPNALDWNPHACEEWDCRYRQCLYRIMQPDGPIIMLIGKSGTGKTQMAVDLIADMCAVGNCYYLTTAGLYLLIRSKYNSKYQDGEESELAMVNRLKSCALLVLDEVHERSGNDWENRLLTNIINGRYGNMLPTVLVANMHSKQMADNLGDSIVSRYHESGLLIDCNWPSFRTKAGV